MRAVNIIFLVFLLVLTQGNALITISFDSLFTVKKLAYPAGLSTSILKDAGLIEDSKLVSSITLGAATLFIMAQTTVYGALAIGCSQVGWMIPGLYDEAVCVGALGALSVVSVSATVVVWYQMITDHMVMLAAFEASVGNKVQFRRLIAALAQQLKDTVIAKFGFNCISSIQEELVNAQHKEDYDFRQLVCTKKGILKDEYIGMVAKRNEDKLNVVLTYTTTA